MASTLLFVYSFISLVYSTLPCIDRNRPVIRLADSVISRKLFDILLLYLSFLFTLSFRYMMQYIFKYLDLMRNVL